jgi:hypothetical protein
MLDDSVVFQAIAWTVGGLELGFTLLCLVYIVSFHFGLAYSTFPFTAMNRLCIFMFHRRFLTPVSPRTTIAIAGCSVAHSDDIQLREAAKCTNVKSLVNVEQFGDDSIDDRGVRKSEEMPLNEV